MKAIYVDSSIAVAILLKEKGASRYRTFFESTKSTILSSNLFEAEVFSAATRESISLRLASDLIFAVSLVFPDRPLENEYQRILAEGYCRGADAYHLATALFLDPSAKELSFLTADHRQEKLAARLGFDCV